MPDWNQVLDELKEIGSTFDVIRRKYLKRLNNYTKRNVIIYYSGWMQKPGIEGTGINDSDKIGLMTTIHKLDRKKGLDLILHTPGGEIAATESIVDYLRQMFGTDIRAIVPQIAMSAGTMIACACRSIVMGAHSSLGPIDPLYKGLPAHGIIEEFNQALDECSIDPTKVPLWQPIIARYSPAMIGECQKAIKWSNEIVREWLLTGMLANDRNKKNKVLTIINELGDHALTKSHSRHLSMSKCESLGLVIEPLEADERLQDLVLTVHHACIHTFSATPAFKIVENHRGTAFIQHSAQISRVNSPRNQLMPE